MDLSGRPGWKTTEFWMSFTAMVVSFAFASDAIPTGSVVDKVLGIAALVLTAAGYSVSRTMVKK